MVNKYNRLVTISWQANTDVSPCTDVHAIIDYIVKYASKSEKKSPSYRDLAQTIIPYVNQNRPYQSFITKIINKLIRERDYSAQEVCCFLLDLPLSKCSKSSISVDCRPEDQHKYTTRYQEGELRRGLSHIEKYMLRDPENETATYLEFL